MRTFAVLYQVDKGRVLCIGRPIRIPLELQIIYLVQLLPYSVREVVDFKVLLVQTSINEHLSPEDLPGDLVVLNVVEVDGRVVRFFW